MIASSLKGDLIMRRLWDFDTELTALGTKANLLKERRVRQLGELVIATGADALGNETDATVQRRSAALHAIEVPDQAASASERVRRRGSPLHGDSGTA